MTPVETDPTSRTRALAREMVERYLNRGDLTDLTLLSPELELYTHTRPEPYLGLDGFCEYIGMIRGGFPDARFEIEQIVAEGDRAVVRWTMRGTHLADIGGLPPTGRRIEISALQFFGFDDTGAMCTDCVEMNTIALLKQLAGIRRIPRPLVWLTRRQLKRQGRDHERIDP